ncbi:hypothetical protein BHS57_22670 [Salmonella enterica]|nr:hypothetical protein [Salmonella enterica]
MNSPVLLPCTVIHLPLTLTAGKQASVPNRFLCKSGIAYAPTRKSRGPDEKGYMNWRATNATQYSPYYMGIHCFI